MNWQLQFDLDPALVLEVVRAESNFDPRARSHKGRFWADATDPGDRQTVQSRTRSSRCRTCAAVWLLPALAAAALRR